MNFDWPIIGHESIQQYLQNSILKHKLSHAYLFYGPNNIGKSSMATHFAMSIMCQDSQTIPCQECAHCKQIKKNIHPDVVFYQKDDNKKEISVEQIREIINKLNTTSFLGSYKIGIIKNAESMSLAAANSLLKTLEEPSHKTILILTAQNISSLPQTIISRCLLVKFLPVPSQTIYQHLLKTTGDRNLTDKLSRASHGLPGIALGYLNKKQHWEEYEKKCQEFLSLFNAPIKNKFQFVEQALPSQLKAADSREVIHELLCYWEIILRDIILLKKQKNDKLTNNWLEDSLFKISQKNDIKQLAKAVDNLRYCRLYLHKNINPKLILENFLIHL